MAQGEPEVEEEEPIQVDAGADQDCCEEIRAEMIKDMKRSLEMTAGNIEHRRAGLTAEQHARLMNPPGLEAVQNMSCEELMASHYATQGWSFTYNTTYADAYNQCAGDKMPMGGDFTTGEPMDIAMRLLKEMYHGTKASPASLKEYGIQPRAEAPATQMGTNMSLFRDWWDAQHKDIEAENKLRRRHNLPLTSREELLQEHEQRQADANKVWMSPNKSYASDYGRPGTDYSAGNVQSAGSQGSVATIDDTGLNLNVGRSPQMEYWHAGAIPQTAVQNIESIETGEPMDLAWRLLKWLGEDDELPETNWKTLREHLDRRLLDNRDPDYHSGREWPNYDRRMPEELEVGEIEPEPHSEGHKALAHSMGIDPDDIEFAPLSQYFGKPYPLRHDDITPEEEEIAETVAQFIMDNIEGLGLKDSMVGYKGFEEYDDSNLLNYLSVKGNHTDIGDINDKRIWPAERILNMPEIEQLKQWAGIDESKLGKEPWAKDIETGEPMDLTWRLLKEEARGPSWPRPDKWGNTYADAADDATKRGRPMMTLSHAELQQIIDDTKEAWGEWLDWSDRFWEENPGLRVAPERPKPDWLKRREEAKRERDIRDLEGSQISEEDDIQHYPVFDLGLEGEEEGEIGHLVEGGDEAYFGGLLARDIPEYTKRNTRIRGDRDYVDGDTFTSHHDTDKDWQDLNRGEPMDIAMRLLKEGR